MVDVNYRYLDKQAQLAELTEECRKTDVIAIDTEFARFNTYYPIVGLIQIYTGHHCYLIDPLALEDLGPLAEILSDQGICKVLHSGSEDMEVFQYALGVVPKPVYDTQIAAAALGVGFSVGYQALVEHHLGLTLPKDQTRSDWLARPLSAEQLDYAALDVIHLLEVYRVQVPLLEKNDRLFWVQSEAAELGQDIPTLTEPEMFYLKMKGLWQLNRRQLNVLKVLCAWRETTARKENVPRNRVVDQKVLMTIARDNANSKQGFIDRGMSGRQVRRYGDDMLFLIAEAKLLPENECPPQIIRTDAPVNNRKLKRLKQVVEEKARVMSVAPELLTRRRYLEKLIRSGDNGGKYELPEELTGWREAVIGRDLLAALDD